MTPNAPSIAWVYAFANSFVKPARLEIYLDASAPLLCDERQRAEWRQLSFKVVVFSGANPPPNTLVTEAWLDSGLLYKPFVRTPIAEEQAFFAAACPPLDALAVTSKSPAPSNQNYLSRMKPSNVVVGENYFFTLMRLLANLTATQQTTLENALGNVPPSEHLNVIQAALSGSRALSGTIREPLIGPFRASFDALPSKGPSNELLQFIYNWTSEQIIPELSSMAQTVASWRAKQSRKDNDNALRPQLPQLPGTDVDDQLARLKQLAIDEPIVAQWMEILRYGDPLPIRPSELPNGGWLLAQPVDAQGKVRSLSEYYPVAVPVRFTNDPTPQLLSALGGLGRNQTVSVIDDYFAKYVVARPVMPWSDPMDMAPNPMVRAPQPSEAQATAFKAIDMHRSVVPATTRQQWSKATEALQSQHDAAVEQRIQNRQPPDPADGDHYASMIEAIVTTVPPYDAIGIVWDQADLAEAARNTQPVAAGATYHQGFRASRVDVQIQRAGLPKTWKSLNFIRRYIKTPDGRRLFQCPPDDGRPREGCAMPSVLGEPGIEKSDDVLVGSHFLVWGGSSAVAKEPLDQLANPGGESTQRGVRVDDSALDVLHVIYRDLVTVRVRNASLTTICPLPTDPGDSGSNATFPWATTPFKRATPIAAPVVALTTHGLVEIKPPQDADVQSNTTGSTSAVPEGAQWSASNHAGVRLKVVPPLAHWRVVSHAFPFDAKERSSDAFRHATYAFAKRSAEKFRQAPGPAQSGPGADYLTGFDPHLRDLEILVRAWYPFSCRDQEGDMFSTIGSAYLPGPMTRKSFADLIITAQKSLDGPQLERTIEIPVAEPGFVDKPNASAPVRLIAGVPMRIEVRGRLDESALSATWWDDPAERTGSPRRWMSTIRTRSARAWTSTILIADMPGQSPQPIGRPASDPAGLTFTLEYGGLADKDGAASRERTLPMVPKPGVSPPQPGDPPEPPLRGTVQSWRQYRFDDPTLDTSFDVRRKLLLDFMSARFHGRVVPDPSQLLIELGPILTPTPTWIEAGITWPTPASFPTAPQGGPAIAHGTLKLGDCSAIRTPSDKKELPFVDRDVRWVVRLAWRIDLSHSHLSRPQDVAFVKEFEICREEVASLTECVVLGRIKRTGADVLIDHNLDQVEFTWIDGIADALTHKYIYTVRAIPEYPGLFADATWFRQEVIVPGTDIATRPAVVPLPMRDTGIGHVALHVRDLDSTQELKIVYRRGNQQPDPVIGGAPRSVPPSLFHEPTVDELFPADVPVIVPVSAAPAPGDLQLPGDEWMEAKPASTTERPPATHPTVRGCFLYDGTPSGNPFVKLEVAVVRTQGYPCLPHAAASDILRTEWLQAYPPPLLGLERKGRIMTLPDAWLSAAPSLIWHRFHIFIGGAQSADPTTSSYHLATFYRKDGALSLDEIEPEISSALINLFGAPPTSPEILTLLVFPQEGLLANSYAFDSNYQVDNNQLPPELVVMRAGTKAATLQCAWKDAEARWAL